MASRRGVGMWGRGGVLALAALLALVLVWLRQRPSTERDWQPNEAVMPSITFRGRLVDVRNVRFTTYRSTEDYTPAYDQRTYDLERLVRVWFVVEPFSKWGGAAHTFLSFEFTGPEFVAISVEARKERGETYHFVKGLFRGYELLYVVGDERDLVRLRSNYRRDEVFLYPIRASPERVRALFAEMLERADALRRAPEFYNTLTSNCTSNIVRHVNRLVPGRVPFSVRWMFPGYADRLAYDLGLIDTALPFDSIRARFRIDERALRYGDREDFSVRIRDSLPPPGSSPPDPLPLTGEGARNQGVSSPARVPPPPAP
ncbi:MAG: DUF4105 domain-containing protein [Gemmatimonadales bacterium]